MTVRTAVKRSAVYQFVCCLNQERIRMWLSSTHELMLILLFLWQSVAFARQDVTTDLFGSEKYGTVAAFGDFNSDKQTDIFIIKERE